MRIIKFLKRLLGLNKQEEKSEITQTQSIYNQKEEIEEIHSVWDYIKLNDNTQAAHICSVLSFDEWIPMDEILRRIKELFRIDYKNDRSLYPYIKTLVDIGIVETTNVGGKKKWRKKDILIKIKTQKDEKEEKKEKIAA